jgi:hypothetical protein
LSRLFANENGRVIPTLGEELTQFRQAKTTFHVSTADEPSSLYILARPFPGGAWPLHIKINNEQYTSINSNDHTRYRWYEIEVKPGVFQTGNNEVTLYTGASAMNAWSLALEPGHGTPVSSVSDDAGHTWRRENMGYLNAVRAEYVVRLRSARGCDPNPPPLTMESVTHPKVIALRERVPKSITRRQSLLERIQALATWVCMSWEHTGSGRATQYAPWDAETILSWGGARTGHNGQRPIVMCVHYAVTFVSLCQALGIPARCLALMGTPNGTDGHFVAEVWMPEFGKWVVVDPNADAMFFDGNEPMSAKEVQAAGEDLNPLVRWGSGSAYQMTFSHIRLFVRENLLKNLCFRHISIWPHANMLSQPQLSPPGHGSISYCETDLVWACEDRERGFGMFRYFADESYFNAEPEDYQ